MLNVESGWSVLALVLLLVMSSGVGAAAVSGDFSGTYDGYGDGETTEPVGHEIAVQGEFEVTGDSAVDPRIAIESAEHTVMDTTTVEVFVEGDRSIQFDRNDEAGQVGLRTDEIPPGTTIRVRFLVYFVGGIDAEEIEAGQVTVRYQTPGGTQQQESFTPMADISDSPDRVIQNLERGESLTWVQEIVSYVGGFAILLLLVIIVLRFRGGGGGGGGIE
jgi:hypothetical protein